MMSDQQRRYRYEPEGNYGSFWNIPAVSYDGSYGGLPQHQSHPHGYYGNGASIPASIPTSLPAGGGPMSPPSSRPQSASPDENSQPPVVYSGRSTLPAYVVKPDPDRSSNFFHHNHKVSFYLPLNSIGLDPTRLNYRMNRNTAQCGSRKSPEEVK